MKYIYLLLFSLLLNIVFSQKETNNWILGYDGSSQQVGWGASVLNFNGSGSPSIYSAYYPVNFSTTNAIISDKAGNILFYTNGLTVYNNTHDTMKNGDGLSPCLFTQVTGSHGLRVTQGAIILPNPGDSNLFYIFHETVQMPPNYYADNLLYSVVDMTKDNGKGELVQKNIFLTNNVNLGIGHFTATKHANGRDWWLIKPHLYADTYYKYLITTNGIQGPFIQTFNDTSMHKRGTEFDQGGFTNEGNKYAYSVGYGSERFYLFDFDRCTGLLSNPLQWDTKDLKSNVETLCIFFSPNSQLMYASTANKLYQYDISASNINSTRKIIAEYDSTFSPPSCTPCSTQFYMGVPAPNGKIYLSSINSTDKLHIINNPDSIGIACDFQQHSLQLPNYMAFGLPNFPNYRLGALLGSACDTLVSYQSAVNSEQVKVYPNPVQEQLHIEMPPEIKGEYTFTLLTMQGQTILAKNMQKLHETIFVGEMAKGMYLYRLETHKENYYGKICIE